MKFLKSFACVVAETLEMYKAFVKKNPGANC